ncbi:MFS transporter [Candidatus Bathyarchaeota archaeon]|nr:MFS transporter [Candidatus Bathyarchaeota archaeon]
MASYREVLRGNVLVIMLSNVIRQLTLFVTFPFFSLYIRALGGSNRVIGLVNALRPLSYMFLYPLAGGIADAYGRVKAIILSGYFSIPIFLLYAIAPDWRILAAAVLIAGIRVIQFPASSAILADSMPREVRGRGYAIVTSLPSLVGILSPFIGGYLISLYGVERAMRLLYVLAAAASGLIATISLRFLKETLPPRRRNIDPKRLLIDSYRDFMEVIRGLPRGLKLYALILVLSTFSLGLSTPYWVVYAKDVIGLKPYEWGVILTMLSLVYSILTLPAGLVIDRYERRKIIALCLAVAVAPILAFPFSKGFYQTLLTMLPIAIVNAFLFPTAGALMADMTPREMRGRVMAALGRGMLIINYRGGGGGGPGMGFFLTIPSILGFLLGGLIYEVNPLYPWLILASTTLVNAVLALMLKGESEE